MTTTTLNVRVLAAESLTPLIRVFRLVAAEGGPLPGYAPGAHVQVALALGAGQPAQWRSYSLINIDPAADTSQAVAEYRIAVRREEDGRGGSRHLHEQVKAGDLLKLRAPTNNFPLAPPPDVVLLAGGIGITPIASMAARLVAEKRGFQLHYSGRSTSQLPFIEELRALCGDRLHLHADDDAATRLALDSLLASLDLQQPIYVCGPAGMIDATLQAAERLGWPRSAVHYELFSEAGPMAGDEAFEVQLKSSGRTLQVAPDKSLLDALLESGADVMYDCRAGYCGLCSTAVCSGEIEHRDTYLSEADKAGGKVMQVCVSRAKGKLVLDL
jgi:vanillate O-demethylase ferredoxin subunit